MRKPKRSAATKLATPRKPALALLRDPRLKKIYVYSEGTFVLHNAAEIKKLVIKTPAFDVSAGRNGSPKARPGAEGKRRDGTPKGAAPSQEGAHRRTGCAARRAAPSPFWSEGPAPSPGRIRAARTLEFASHE